MACVTYDCIDCGNFWTEGNGIECPKCFSTSTHVEWDEWNDDEWAEGEE